MTDDSIWNKAVSVDKHWRHNLCLHHYLKDTELTLHCVFVLHSLMGLVLEEIYTHHNSHCYDQLYQSRKLPSI